MIRALFISLCLIFALTSFSAGNPREALQAATLAYDSGDFEKCAELLEELIASGYGHPDLHYNLANSYYRQGMAGPAILNYERALRHRPKSRSIRHNLNLAQTLIEDPVIPIEQFFLRRWFEGMRDLLSSGGWALLSILCLGLLAALLTRWLWSTGRRPYFGPAVMLLLSLFLLVIICGVSKYHAESDRNAGIIMQPEVKLQTAPDADSPTLEVIQAGEKILLLDQIDDWHKVRLVNMEEGWLTRNVFERI